ncbi:hypothetical protein OIU84_000774 [Salix udensis]|uniref:Translation initiation factor 5A-like N-terminal domain-containing protein n=1 Tax=Salix udensis TaxID=889485 RepID=A0AAD6L5I5_9ROSI|nr:hypothetical protein OIU84_000774 [Salix udensis]
MSDEEHHFESKADAGASKTYPQQAGTIRKNGYIVIKNRPCKVYFSLVFLCSCYGFHLGFCFFRSQCALCKLINKSCYLQR